ncbi:MAG: glucan biosynthesis protein D, partial [Pseudomonadota bacterium]
MKPETRIKLFSAIKKKTFLGVLLAMSAGHSYAVEEPDQPKVTETEQTAAEVQATENEKQQVKDTTAVELKPAMITIPEEKLFEVITARAKKLASEPYVAPKELELEALTNI